MPDPVNFKLDRLSNVVSNELKAGVIPPLAKVVLAAGKGVVETKNLLTGLHEPINEMGSKKTSTAGDKVANRTVRHRQLELMR